MTNRSLKCQIECQLVGVKESTYLILFGYNNYILHVSTCYIYVWSCFATVSSNFTGGQFAQGVQAHHPPTLLHRPLDNSAWAWQLSPRLLVLSNSKSFQKWSKMIIKIGWSIHWWNMITYDIWSHEASKTTKILLCWTDQKWKCSALYKPFSINLRVAAPAEGLVQQTRLAPVWAKHPLQSLGLQHKATRTCEAPVSPGCGSQANSQELLVGVFQWTLSRQFGKPHYRSGRCLWIEWGHSESPKRNTNYPHWCTWNWSRDIHGSL